VHFTCRARLPSKEGEVIDYLPEVVTQYLEGIMVILMPRVFGKTTVQAMEEFRSVMNDKRQARVARDTAKRLADEAAGRRERGEPSPPVRG
jgi:hypothetical protein